MTFLPLLVFFFCPRQNSVTKTFVSNPLSSSSLSPFFPPLPSGLPAGPPWAHSSLMRKGGRGEGEKMPHVMRKEGNVGQGDETTQDGQNTKNSQMEGGTQNGGLFTFCFLLLSLRKKWMEGERMRKSGLEFSLAHFPSSSFLPPPLL